MTRIKLRKVPDTILAVSTNLGFNSRDKFFHDFSDQMV